MSLKRLPNIAKPPPDAVLPNRLMKLAHLLASVAVS
jgi:hypothetical protein